MFDIKEDDLAGAATRDLLAHHIEQMHATSPPGSVFTLDLAGLRDPAVTVWTAWRQQRIAAIAALRDLKDGTGELKSMRTAPNLLRRGAASALLDHVIQIARERRMHRLSLETGSGLAFKPALTLYRRRGFKTGSAFGCYEATEFNQFLHLAL